MAINSKFVGDWNRWKIPDYAGGMKAWFDARMYPPPIGKVEEVPIGEYRVITAEEVDAVKRKGLPAAVLNYARNNGIEFVLELMIISYLQGRPITLEEGMPKTAETEALLREVKARLRDAAPMARPVGIPVAYPPPGALRDEWDDGFEDDWSDKKERKRPTAKVETNGRRTIEELIVLLNFRDMVQAPENLDNWKETDRKLFNAGIRVGQTWSVSTPNYRTQISPIGHYKNGFIWVTPGKVDPSTGIMQIHADKEINKHKEDFLALLQSSKPPLVSTIQSRCLDENGIALPGWEVEAALACLHLRPMFWRDPSLEKDFFLSFCEEGHLIFSDKPVALGIPCSKACQESKDSEAAKSLFDFILYRVMRSDIPGGDKVVFTPTSSHAKARAFASYSQILSSADGSRIRTAFREPSIKSPAWLPTEQEITILAETTTRMHLEHLKSGDILPLNVGETGEKFFVKAHRRACGYFHFEISPTMIFTGETSWKLLNRLLRSEHFSLGNFGKDIPLSGIHPIMRCPICKSRDPLFVTYSEGDKPSSKEKGYQKKLAPITPETIRRNTLPTKGDVLFYKKKPCIVDSDVDKAALSINDREAIRLTVINQKGEKMVVSFKETKLIEKPTSAVKALFYDKDGFLLQRKLGTTNWMKAITIGSILVAVRGSLAGQEVTCASEPFKMGNDWHVRIAESETTMSLYTDLRMKDTYPVSERDHIQINHHPYLVKEIQSGAAIIERDIPLEMRDDTPPEIVRIPKLGLDLLRGRGVLRQNSAFKMPWLAHEAGLIDQGQAMKLNLEKMKKELFPNPVQLKKKAYKRAYKKKAVFIKDPPVMFDVLDDAVDWAEKAAAGGPPDPGIYIEDAMPLRAPIPDPHMEYYRMYEPPKRDGDV